MAGFNDFTRPYPSQYDLRGETLTCYGSDFRDCITYNFNSQGYRADYDYSVDETEPLLVSLGSSIATGHGLDLKDSYSSLLASQLNCKLWNLGQGCFRSSNQTMLEQVEFLVDQPLDIKYWLIQFTHINRQGNKYSSYLELDQELNVQNFENILKQISKLLHNQSWAWIMLDYSRASFSEYVTTHPNCAGIDPDIDDHVVTQGYEQLAPSTRALELLSLHPGIVWNQVTANKYAQVLAKQTTR